MHAHAGRGAREEAAHLLRDLAVADDELGVERRARARAHERLARGQVRGARGERERRAALGVGAVERQVLGKVAAAEPADDGGRAARGRVVEQRPAAQHLYMPYT